MKIAASQKSQRGSPWSRIQPKIAGVIA